MPRQSLSNNGKKDHKLNFKQTTSLYLQRLTWLFERTKEGTSFRKVLVYCIGDTRAQGPLTRAIFHVISEAIYVARRKFDVCFCTLVATKSHVDDMGDFKSHLYG